MLKMNFYQYTIKFRKLMQHFGKSTSKEIQNAQKQKSPQYIAVTPIKQVNDQSGLNEMRLVNPQTEGLRDAGATLKKLISMNQKYLIEKTKISDVPKPRRYSHKMPSKTGCTQYNDHYASASKSYNTEENTPQRNKTASLQQFSNQSVAGYHSTYNNDYALQKQLSNLDKAKGYKPKARYQPMDAPNFLESSYHRDYKSVGQSRVISAKQPEVRLMGGGRLTTVSTYKQNYRVKTQNFTVAQPILHKNHKIFISLQANPIRSSYQASYIPNQQNIKIEESCKPKAKYSENPSKVKYRTEYSEMFGQPVVPAQRDFEFINRDELKDYVMNIINQ